MKVKRICISEMVYKQFSHGSNEKGQPCCWIEQMNLTKTVLLKESLVAWDQLLTSSSIPQNIARSVHLFLEVIHIQLFKPETSNLNKYCGLLIEILIIMHTFLGTGHFYRSDFGSALWLVHSGYHRNQAEQWARLEVMEGSNTCSV